MADQTNIPADGVQTPDLEDQWQLSIRIPAHLPREMRDELISAVVAAVTEWEPGDRDGWDVDITGHPAGWKPDVLDLRDALRSVESQLDDLQRLRVCLKNEMIRRG